MTTKHFDLNIDELDNDGNTFDESDLQDLEAIAEELGDLPPVDEVVDFSDFEALLQEDEKVEEEKEPEQEKPVQIIEEQTLPELPIEAKEVELKVEEQAAKDPIQTTAIEELRDLLPKAKQTLPTAPKVKATAKTAQTANPMRYPNLMLYVSEAVADWIHNNESEDVDNYLKKKLTQANGTRTVKVGPTRVRPTDTNTGDFVWTLKGKVYPQVAKFNATEDRWELAEH